MVVGFGAFVMTVISVGVTTVDISGDGKVVELVGFVLAVEVSRGNISIRREYVVLAAAAIAGVVL